MADTFLQYYFNTIPTIFNISCTVCMECFSPQPFLSYYLS